MKKYTNLIVLGILLLVALVFFIIKNVNFNDLLLSVGYYDERITIVNTADIHGHLVYDDDDVNDVNDVNIIMGMPLIKYLKDEIKKKDEDLLFFDSGDLFHGPNEGCMEEGKGVVEMANIMGYSAMTPGNHDFNYGVERLLEIKDQINYPMINSNIFIDGKQAFEEYKIFEVKGIKIAVFGLTFGDAIVAVSNARDFYNTEIKDHVETAQKLVPELRKKADVVVLLSHLGDDLDMDLANKVDGIDIILSAHLHALIKTPRVVNNTYIVEPGGWATHIGVSELYFKNGKFSKYVWNVITSRDKEKADPEANAIGQRYHNISFEQQKEVIGWSEVKLIGMRSLVRTQETNLGNLIADAMKEMGKAEIAIMNSGGIRQNLENGDIRIYDLGKVLPFTNKLLTVELKGDAIYSIIERGLNHYPSSSNGGFLQVSGISYEFDASKLAGERLVSITKDGKPLDRDRYYKVAANDYLHKGGDLMKEFIGTKIVYSGDLLKDMMVEYIKDKKVVNPQVDGRIKIIGQRYK